MEVIKPVEFTRNNILRHKLYLLARSKYIKNRLSLYNTDSEKSLIRNLHHYTTYIHGEGLCINYRGYTLMKLTMGKLGSEILPLTLFLKLYNGNSSGSIPLEYMETYMYAKYLRKKLAYAAYYHDTKNTGYLTENSLRLFFLSLEELSNEFEMAEKLRMSYFYMRHITSLTLFFLDPFKTRSVKITDLLKSTIPQKIEEIDDFQSGCVTINLNKNYLSCQYMMEHLKHYAEVTRDSMAFTGESLKKLAFVCPQDGFIERFFEVTPVTGSDHDYEHYIHLYMAYTHLYFIQSLKYFFEIFDTNSDGYICEWDLKYFYKAIQSPSLELGTLQPFENFTNELFDMILGNRKHVRKFSLNELVRSQAGPIMIKTLVERDNFMGHYLTEI